MVERWPYKPDVVGSTPTPPTKALPVQAAGLSRICAGAPVKRIRCRFGLPLVERALQPEAPDVSRESNFLHRAFHVPDAVSYQVANSLIWGLIVISITLLGVDLAVPEDWAYREALGRVDDVLLAVFAIEVTLRVLSYRPPYLDVFKLSPAERARVHLWGRLKYCLRPLNLIDILTVAALVPALRGLRALRLLRLMRTSKIFRYNDVFASMGRSFSDNGLLFGFALSAVMLSTLVGGVSLFLVERAKNPAVTHLGDGLWWALVTLTTVGFGDIAPTTSLGRLVGGFLMVAGMFCLALFAGVVGHTLLHAVVGIREEQFRLSERSGHTVVFGYEPDAHLLLDSLIEEMGHSAAEVVLFAAGDRPPNVQPRFTWVSGDCTKESELSKVSLTRANGAVVVGRRSLNPALADSVTLMTLFTIRSFMAKAIAKAPRMVPLYVVAEIMDAENVEHARAAGADEVIEGTKLTYSLLAHAISAHGTGRALSVVARPRGMSTYVGRLPADTRQTTFGELMVQLKQEYGILLLGLRGGERNEVINPDAGTTVSGGDVVIYLASAPALPAADEQVAPS